MNATLQCLFHCEPLAQFICRHAFRRLALMAPSKLTSADLADGEIGLLTGQKQPKEPRTPAQGADVVFAMFSSL